MLRRDIEVNEIKMIQKGSEEGNTRKTPTRELSWVLFEQQNWKKKKILIDGDCKGFFPVCAGADRREFLVR